MSVNLSLFAGVGWQFFNNNGTPLAGGLIYTYAAGTTTPQATYTSSTGTIAHANPIVLNSAGRVATGQVWITDGLNYKFVLQDSTATTIATYDNVNSTYISSDLAASSGSSLIGFIQAGTGAVAETVQAKLRQIVNVKDVGAVCDGATDDWAAISAYVLANSNVCLSFPANTTTMVSQSLPLRDNTGYACFDGVATIKALASSTDNVIGNAVTGSYSGIYMQNLIIDGNKTNCAWNTRNGGLTDDQYQHGVRLFNISKSRFVNIKVKNAVMCGWSLYGANTDNEFTDCSADDTGKSANPAGGSWARRGIYMEVGASRNKWLRPRITNPYETGIWHNSDTGTDTDNEWIDAYLSDNGSCTGDGFVIEVLGTSIIQREKFTGTVIGFNAGAGTNVGVHIIQTSGTGVANDCRIEATVKNCGYGFVIAAGAQRTLLVAPNSTNNANYGVGISAGAVDTVVVGGFSGSNGTDFIDAGTRSKYWIDTTSGLMYWSGTVTNDSAPAGSVGEYISSFVGVTSFPATTTYGDLTSISLTAGDWDVCAMSTANLNGATQTDWRLGIGTTSGATFTGAAYGLNILGGAPPTSGYDSSLSLPAVRLSLATTTTVYLKAFSTYSSGTPRVLGAGLYARRAR